MSDKDKIEVLEKRVARLELALENLMSAQERRPRRLTEGMKSAELEIENNALNALSQLGRLTPEQREDNVKNQMAGRILPKPFQ